MKRFAVLAMATLPVMTFTVPGRPVPSALRFLDVLAISKLMILAYVCVYGTYLLVSCFRQPLFQRVLSPLMPFVMYLAWSIFSVVWSPLKAVTIGQAGGLAALLVYAIAVGMICYDNEMVSRVLKALANVMLAFSAFVLAIHLCFPAHSGLERELVDSGADGVVHPTASGSAASLGLLITVMARVIGQLRWSTRFCLATVAVHSAVMYYSNSRGSTVLAILISGLVVFLFSDNRKRAIGLVSAAVVLVGVIALDPGLQWVSKSAGSGAQYFARGQSLDEIREVSGRSEMWSAIWNEYIKSPIIGHGYFVTSEGGAVEVWNIFTNHTAHNIYLQVLASTGLIGMLLFVVAILSLVIQFLLLEGGSGSPGRTNVQDLPGAGRTNVQDLPGAGRTNVQDLPGAGRTNVQDLPGAGRTNVQDLPGAGRTNVQDLPGTGRTNVQDLPGTGRTNVQDLPGTGRTNVQDLLGAGRVGWMISFIALWYLVWSMTCVSFLGPVRAESVVFFTFIGIGVGQSLRRQPIRCPAEPVR